MKDQIIVERFPAERLPREFADAQQLGAEVRITFEPAPASDEEDMPLTRILEEMQSKRVFSDDPVKRIRALRSEWDWRDEFHDRIRSGDA
jgi:hypothetical protein